MNARDVRDALLTRWPADQFVTVEEAPETPDRMGRKLDAVVISCWKSRGYELDGVEIKISISDWRREVTNPAKADFWWNHVHRFWIACPVEIAPKIRENLPGGWGLIACSEGKTTTVVASAKHKPLPLTWPQTVGLIRSAQNCGMNALRLAEERGYRRGKEASTDSHAVEALRATIASYQERISIFEEASGLKLASWGRENAQLGRTVALVRNVMSDPNWSSETLRRAVIDVGKAGEALTKIADALDGAMSPE